MAAGGSESIDPKFPCPRIRGNRMEKSCNSIIETNCLSVQLTWIQEPTKQIYVKKKLNRSKNMKKEPYPEYLELDAIERGLKWVTFWTIQNFLS